MPSITYSCNLDNCHDLDKLRRDLNGFVGIANLHVPPCNDGSTPELTLSWDPTESSERDLQVSLFCILIENEVKLYTESGALESCFAYESKTSISTGAGKQVSNELETEIADDWLRWLRCCEKLLPKDWRDGALGDLLEDIEAMGRDGIPRARIRLIVIGQFGILAICALFRFVVSRVVSTVIGG